VAGKFGTVDRRDPGDMLPDAGVTGLQYDREMRLSTIKDAAGHDRKIGYDPQGRVMSKEWPFDGTDKTLHKYTYDADGNLHTYEDTRNNVTTFEYDGYDRRSSELAPGAYTDADPGAVVDPQLTK
jgi:YD repeat-containing protein